MKRGSEQSQSGNRSKVLITVQKRAATLLSSYPLYPELVID